MMGWTIEKWEDGYWWVVAGEVSAGPFIRKAEARHFAAVTAAPKEEEQEEEIEED
jgi:hypothetical protein